MMCQKWLLRLQRSLAIHILNNLAKNSGGVKIIKLRWKNGGHIFDLLHTYPTFLESVQDQFCEPFHPIHSLWAWLSLVKISTFVSSWPRKSNLSAKWIRIVIAPVKTLSGNWINSWLAAMSELKRIQARKSRTVLVDGSHEQLAVLRIGSPRT